MHMADSDSQKKAILITKTFISPFVVVRLVKRWLNKACEREKLPKNGDCRPVARFIKILAAEKWRDCLTKNPAIANFISTFQISKIFSNIRKNLQSFGAVNANNQCCVWFKKIFKKRNLAWDTWFEIFSRHYLQTEYHWFWAKKRDINHKKTTKGKKNPASKKHLHPAYIAQPLGPLSSEKLSI